MTPKQKVFLFNIIIFICFLTVSIITYYFNGRSIPVCLIPFSAVTLFFSIAMTKKIIRPLNELNEKRYSYRDKNLSKGNISEKLEKIIAAQKSGKQAYLLYIDIDKFKTINKLFGYYAGNELINLISNNIKNELENLGSKKHTFMHIINDEFAIILYGTKGEACKFAGKIIEKTARAGFVWNEKRIVVCISVGIVPILSKEQDAQDTLISGYDACALAYSNGGNCYKFLTYEETPVFNTKNIEFWLTSIQRALKENNFVLYQQAIVPLKTDSIPVHPKYEILIRLKTNDGDIVSPDNFIPIAEHYNMIYEIDKWVIDSTFAYYKHLEENNLPDKNAMFSINVSADSFFSNDLIEFINKTRKKYRVPAKNFCFELTESCAARNLEATQEFVVKLRQQGFSFALDDFGKGFSSFPYLKTLPIDYVKIDGSFIKTIDTDYVDYSIVKTMRDMCHHLGLYTVAEYAENDSIISKLKEIGLDYGQGYGFYKPQPITPRRKNKIF